MKFSAGFLALLVAANGAHGFVSPAKPAFVSQLNVVAEPEVEEAVAVAAPVAEPSGWTAGSVHKAVRRLNASNFSQTLSDMEPFLLNEAGATIYSKSLKRIAIKASEVGVEMPAGYAKLAKATEKRRAKQDAFIARKEEERLAAEAEAAEAAAGAAEEEAAPAEE